MFVPKGYRAREAAARERSQRGRANAHIRIQRAAHLEPKIEAAIQASKDRDERDPVPDVAEQVSPPVEQSQVETPADPPVDDENDVDGNADQDQSSDESTEADESDPDDADASEDEDEVAEGTDQEDAGEATDVSTDQAKPARRGKSKSKSKNK